MKRGYEVRKEAKVKRGYEVRKEAKVKRGYEVRKEAKREEREHLDWEKKEEAKKGDYGYRIHEAIRHHLHRDISNILRPRLHHRHVTSHHLHLHRHVI